MLHVLRQREQLLRGDLVHVQQRGEARLPKRPPDAASDKCAVAIDVEGVVDFGRHQVLQALLQLVAGEAALAVHAEVLLLQD